MSTRVWPMAVLLLNCFAGSVNTEPDHSKGLILQLRRRDGVNRTRGLLRNATLPLHGAVRDYGYFYASLYLGTPARSFAVIVDTGSTITYVPCKTCGHFCGSHHRGAAFDPQSSSTVANVGCGSDQCVCGRPSCGCSAKQECTYSRTYAEQSSSSGMLLQDVLHLNSGARGAVPVVFGCETKETGEIYNQEADGILGLGNSPISIVNQLTTEGVIEDVFSLCFGSVEGDGALMLGDVGLPKGVELLYTPLFKSAVHPHYYVVNLMRIAVDGQDIPAPAGLYEEGYGTVLDSGTTFTYLPSEAFSKFVSQVAQFAVSKGLRKIDGPDKSFNDICFGGAPPIEQADRLFDYFPTMDLHFAGGVALKAGPLNYLFIHSTVKGGYCLGVFDNQHQGTLLGGITFRNVFVQYDRRNKRVGFGPAACQKIGQNHVPQCPDNANFTRPDGSRIDLDCIPLADGRPGQQDSVFTARSVSSAIGAHKMVWVIFGVTLGFLALTVATVVVVRRRLRPSTRDAPRNKFRRSYSALSGVLGNVDKISRDGSNSGMLHELDRTHGSLSPSVSSNSNGGGPLVTELGDRSSHVDGNVKDTVPLIVGDSRS